MHCFLTGNSNQSDKISPPYPPRFDIIKKPANHSQLGMGLGSLLTPSKTSSPLVFFFRLHGLEYWRCPCLKPPLHALKNRHGKPNFWHRADVFKARHSQFSTCKRIGPKCNMAPVLKILGVPRLPPGGSLGTGKRGTVPKIWRAVPIFLARVNGV